MALQSESEFQAKLLLDFLDEAHFILDSMDECLFGLEPQSAGQNQLIDNLFRYAHTIKGSSAVVGLNDVMHFAHSFEDLLSHLREHPQRLSVEIQQILLESSACLRRRFETLRSGAKTPWCPDDLVQKLQAAVNESTTRALPKPNLGYGFFDDEDEAAAEPSPHLTTPPSLHREGGPLSGDGTPSQESSANSSTALSQVKVSSKRLDAVVDHVGELIVLKSQLLTELEANLSGNPRLQSLYASFERIVRDIQDQTLGLRMAPLKPLFLKMRRLVHDTARKCDKQVHFTISGEEVEVERSIAESLHDPIMHMLRNAIDHGLEASSERRAAGKEEAGTLQLKAMQLGSNVIIEVSDDGKGLARERISHKAQEKGLVAADALKAMSDEAIYNLIFLPGFSTAETVSDLSGRGVGLDVVSTNIRKMRGSIKLQSQLGQGTTFSLALPVEAAITDGILAKVQETSYIFPLDAIQELLALDKSGIVPLTRYSSAIKVRDKIVPLIYLDSIVRGQVQASPYNQDGAKKGVFSVIAIESQGRNVGVVVDEIVGQTQVVLKCLASGLKTSRAVAGTAVLGDGKVAIVLNAKELVGNAA